MINLHVLDKLVEQHLQFEIACRHAFDKTTIAQSTDVSDAPSDADIHVALLQIRNHIMKGFVDAALTICDAITPTPLDASTQLNARIHKLVELLHRAECQPSQTPHAHTKALSDALEYSTLLAAYALDAFPEAYQRFVDSMMLLIQTDQISSESYVNTRRRALADELVSTVRLTVSARHSTLSFLLRYLIILYLQFHTPVLTAHQPATPLLTILQAVLDFRLDHNVPSAQMVWRLDGPSLSRMGILNAFDEADVQALRERVNISRQEAINALNFTNGDLAIALRNELARIMLSEHRVRALVYEYCLARGLSIVQVEEAALDHTADDTLVMVSQDGLRVLVRPTDFSAQVTLMWRVMSSVRSALALPNRLAAVQGVKVSIAEADLSVSDAAEVHFRLGFRECVVNFEEGCLEKALQIVRNDLTPLVNDRKDGTQSFAKLERLLMFLACARNDAGMDENVGCDTCASCAFDELVKDLWKELHEFCSWDVIVHEIYGALQQKFGESDLVMILQGLVDTHGEWACRNMFTDRLASALSVDMISQSGFGNASEDAHETADKRGSNDSSGAHSGVDGGGDGDQVNGGMEVKIVTLMEFLAVSRAEALAIIRNHPHASAQAILESFLGSA